MSDEKQKNEAIARIETLANAFQAVEAFEFPRLTPDRVTDDGETYDALRCPWCAGIAGTIIAVDFAERWTTADEISDEDFLHEEVLFCFEGSEFDGTLYYRAGCCDKPVALPEGWTETAR